MKNCKLPKYIINLIKSSNNNNNFDYFQEKPNEMIQFQNLCFSYKNLIIIYQIIANNIKTLIDDNKNPEQKKILDEFYKNLNIFILEIIENHKNEQRGEEMKYFYLSKIIYNDKIEKILEDKTIKNLNKKDVDFDLSIYKNCLIQILSYNNFYYLTEFKKFSENQKSDKNREKIGKNGLKSSIINSLEAIDEEGADFKNTIFPIIESNIILEMDSRYDELIFYCTNYLRENIDNLPPEYIDKNYSLLFDELITETKNKINFLNFFELYHKINEAEKINILSFNYNLRIKKLEKMD